MLDAVKWLERIVDELSHKRRKELYQEWLRDWTMTGVITYEINFSEVAQAYKDEAAQKRHLANEEYKVALQLASQMVDPAVMAARMLPSKLPVMKRELMVVCLRTRAVTAEERGEEKSNLVILPTPKRVENGPESVSNPTQPVDELAALDKLLGKFPSESVELRGITKDYMDGVTDGISAVMETPWPATPAADDDDSSEPPPKSAA